MQTFNASIRLWDWEKYGVVGKPIFVVVESSTRERELIRVGWVENEHFVQAKECSWAPAYLHHTQALEFSESVGDLVYRYMLRVLGAQESLWEPPEC